MRKKFFFLNYYLEVEDNNITSFQSKFRNLSLLALKIKANLNETLKEKRQKTKILE